MAPFASKTVRARAQSAVNNETAPAAGSHNDAKDTVVALACACQRFGKGKAVGVVFNGNSLAKGLFDHILKGKPIEALRVGVTQPLG